MIISIAMHKGGVGKTTSSVNIGAALAKMDKKVLLVDFDVQANLSTSLGIDVENIENNIYESIRENSDIETINIKENLDVCPSHLDLSCAEIEMSSEPGREFILKELLDPLKDQYDYIIIDCPPSLGLLTVNALVASDSVYMPLQSEFLAVRGLSKLTEIIEKIKRRLNKTLEFDGIFITQHDSRKILNRQVETSIKENFTDILFNTRIRNNISLAEAPSQGQDIFEYHPASAGAEDYMELAKEIISKHS